MDYLLGMILGILLCSQWHLLSENAKEAKLLTGYAYPVEVSEDFASKDPERRIEKSRKLIERKKRV